MVTDTGWDVAGSRRARRGCFTCFCSLSARFMSRYRRRRRSRRRGDGFVCSSHFSSLSLIFCTHV